MVQIGVFDENSIVEENCNRLATDHWKDLDYDAKIMLKKWWIKMESNLQWGSDRQAEVKRYPFGPKREEDI